MVKCEKVVVFDLDETLGHFVELGIFLDCLENILKKKLSDKEFFELIDLFPEFVRPNIIPILKLIVSKKKENVCSKIMIYTNNQGPKEWALRIKKYFEHKLKTQIFDQVIAAYQVHGKQVELCRTTHDKSYDDFLACTKLPKSTRVCFLDDQYHSKMEHDNVVYINLKPYWYTLPFDEMAKRYVQTHKIKNPNVYHGLVRNMSKFRFGVYKKQANEQRVDEVVGKKVHKHLSQFLRKPARSKKKTTRKKKE